MSDTKIDLNRPNLDKLIDNFIDIIKAMLARTSDRKSVYSRIIASFDTNETDQILAIVRKISHDTEDTFRLHWDFSDLYKAANLNEQEKQLFKDRVKSIVSVQSEFIPENGFRDWNNLENLEQDNIFESVNAAQTDVLRIYIDGEWDMHNVHTFLFGFNVIYSRFPELYIMEKYKLTYDNAQYHPLQGNAYNLGDFSNLQILQMQYASPGHFDFLGIGNIFQQLIDIINKVIHWKQEYKLVKLQRTKQQFDLIKEMKLDLDKLGLDIQTRRELEAKLDGTAKEIFNWLEPEQITAIDFKPKELTDHELIEH